MSESLLASLVPPPDPEPEQEPEPETESHQPVQYVAVRACDVTDGCDGSSRVIGSIKVGDVVTVHARVTNLPVQKGCTRVCFRTPRLSMLEGPNQWVSLRSPQDGSVHLEELPRPLPTGDRRPPPLPWEGCESIGPPDQLRTTLCELTAEEARRRVALLMMELSSVESLKSELQLLKATTREQQRLLATLPGGS